MSSAQQPAESSANSQQPARFDQSGTRAHVATCLPRKPRVDRATSRPRYRCLIASGCQRPRTIAHQHHPVAARGCERRRNPDIRQRPAVRDHRHSHCERRRLAEQRQGFGQILSSLGHGEPLARHIDLRAQSHVVFAVPLDDLRASRSEDAKNPGAPPCWVSLAGRKCRPAVHVNRWPSPTWESARWYCVAASAAGSCRSATRRRRS